MDYKFIVLIMIKNITMQMFVYYQYFIYLIDENVYFAIKLNINNMKKKNLVQNEIEMFRTTISPPNPILDTSKQVQQQLLKLRLLKNQNSLKMDSYFPYDQKNNKQKDKRNMQNFNYEVGDSDSLIKKYQNCQLVYKRFENNKYNKIGNISYLTSLFINPKQILKRYQSKKEDITIFDSLPKAQQIILRENVLKFDSNFESGNLFAAYYINDNEYDLLLQNDINTKGNNQWYYFSVTGARKNQSVKFNIINLVIQIIFSINLILYITKA